MVVKVRAAEAGVSSLPFNLLRSLGACWPLFAAAAVVITLGIPTLLFPFGPDQSIFAYIAHRMIQGGFPYVDAWDQKPPGIFAIYVLAIQFPGPLMRNVRLFDLFVLALTLVALYLLAAQLWDRVAGSFAALLYGAAYTTLYGYWHTAQPDGYVALPLALALWLYYRALRGKTAWPYLAAGLLLGFAFQLRFFSSLVGLGLLYVEWHQRHLSSRPEWTPSVRRMGWVAAGFMLTQALFGAYLLVGHALAAYLFTEFRFATGYARLGGAYSPNGFEWGLYLDAARSNTVEFLTTHLFVSFPAAVAALLAFRIGGDRRTRELTVFLVVAYAGVLIQAKFFWYHWLAVLPLLAVLGGKGLADCCGHAALEHTRAAATLMATSALAALVLLSPVMTDNAAKQWQDFVRYFADPGTRHAFNNQFGRYGDGAFSYLADDELARYIIQHTTAQESVYVFGYEPLVYLISGRESASRFIYAFPVMSTWAPLDWKSEFMAELESRKPRYIVIQANEGAPWITGLHEDTAHFAAHFAPLQNLLADRYVKETAMEDFTLYRLRD